MSNHRRSKVLLPRRKCAANRHHDAFKALILKADESVFEILRHLIGIDPDSVLLSVELSHLNELIVAVIGIDERGLVLIRLVVVEIYRDLTVGKRHDIEKT